MLYTPHREVFYGPPTLEEYLAELDKIDEEFKHQKRQQKEFERTMYDDMSGFCEPQSLIDCSDDEAEPCFEWDPENNEWIDHRSLAMGDEQDKMHKIKADETYRHLYMLYKHGSCGRPETLPSQKEGEVEHLEIWDD